jgi:nucleotide-binding universal stress UspA family protein
MESSPAGEARLGLAILLARHHQAALTLLQLLDCVHEPGKDEEAILAAEAAAQRLRERINREGVRAEWRIARSVADVERIEAKLADLTILGRLDCQADPAVRPETVALASGRPVLVLPGEGPFEEMGRHVVVAWDGSREASRATRDALPLMERAEIITIVSVTDPGGGRGRPPAIPLGYLQDYGLRAEFEEIIDADREIVATLLARCAELDADLLVMGAYGHSRLTELVLGGATRGILQDTTLPVLLSH